VDIISYRFGCYLFLSNIWMRYCCARAEQTSTMLNFSSHKGMLRRVPFERWDGRKCTYGFGADGRVDIPHYTRTVSLSRDCTYQVPLPLRCA
jgi:hypothetical protein